MKPRRLVETLSDMLNPIVVKELRQAVKSKFVVAVLLLFLGLQLLAAGIYLVVASETNGLGLMNPQAGSNLFSILHIIMLATCVLFVPLYTGIRVAAERSDAHVDLLFVTTLPPRAIIGGKFLAALVLTVIIFSACTPFLLLTYFLRGIDAQTILFVVGVDFVAVAFAVMAAIFVALIPAHWIFKAVLGLVGFIALLVFMQLVITMTSVLMEGPGVGGSMELLDFWGATCCALAGVLGICALLFSWSAALLSPPSANRAFLYRLVLVVAWVLGLATALTWNVLLPNSANGPMGAFVVFAAAVTSLGMAIAVNERESWTPRSGPNHSAAGGGVPWPSCSSVGPRVVWPCQCCFSPSPW